MAAGSGCSLRTATEKRVYPSSTTLSVRIPTVSGSRRRTIRPTTAPRASVSGSLSSLPGTACTVSTASPSGSAASTTSRSTASSQDSTSAPSTVSRSTGCSAPSASGAHTSRTWSWRKRRCTVTAAGPSCGASRTCVSIPGCSPKLAASAFGGPRTPNCQRERFLFELARYG